MNNKLPLRIETNITSVFFYLDDILLHSTPNRLSQMCGYRHEGYNGFGHFDAYLKENKIYYSMNFKGEDYKQKTIKTYQVVPKKKLIEIMRIIKQVAE